MTLVTMLSLHADDIVPTIKEVKTFGYWESKGKDGTFRYIWKSGGWDTIKHALSLELLVRDPHVKGYRVIKTIEIKPLQNPNFLISSIRFLRTSKKKYLLIDYSNSNGDLKSFSYEFNQDNLTWSLDTRLNGKPNQ